MWPLIVLGLRLSVFIIAALIIMYIASSRVRSWIDFAFKPLTNYVAAKVHSMRGR